MQQDEIRAREQSAEFDLLRLCGFVFCSLTVFLSLFQVTTAQPCAHCPVSPSSRSLNLFNSLKCFVRITYIAPFPTFVCVAKMELHQDSSPYINDLSDFPDAQHHSSTSPFDQFDFSNLSSTFPHTPSYNGSYHNSPFSAHSELSFSGEADQFGLFDEEPLVTREDYDPSEYDPPNSGGLLMFPNFMENGSGNGAGDQAAHVSVTPAFDYSSPSSNGGADSGPDGQPRSRGSSISSNPNNNSPRLDVTQGFENMRFESPNWGTHVLPGADRSISPPHKPQSPPQLLIPDSSTGSSGNVYGPSPPVINAPDGDGDLMGAGPQLHIVPATPISGGGGTSQPVPFQSSLETLQQGK